jgi:membrane-bound lytic murein transglycosylase D
LVKDENWLSLKPRRDTKSKILREILYASPYLYYILTEAERYGLPSELALIPIVESDYNSFVANSTGRYDGIWQFIPSTGRGFGLYEDSNINDRRNIVKATNAAMGYFNYLNLMFRQWDVAIGSYNWGPGNMYKAIDLSGQKIGNVNYSTLPLREITANYVPKLIALANIIRNPNKFGVNLMELPNKPYFAIVHPINSVTVADINNISQTNNETFKILNPQFKHSRYSLNQQTAVLLPIQNLNLYLASTNGTNKKPIMLAATLTATSNISAKTNDNSFTVDNDNSNNISSTANSTNSVTHTQNNIVPVAYSSDTDNNQNDAINQVAYVNENNGSINTTSNTTTTNNAQQATNKPILIIPKQSGEQSNPITIAHDNKNEQVINDLVDNINDNNPHSGRLIKVSQTKIVTAAKHIKYRVHKGDTLYSIARKFNVEVDEIKKANKIHSNHVKTGQLLIIKTHKNIKV